MGIFGPFIALFAGLFIIVLGARQMGAIFARCRLPLISGFLFTGIIAGPFVLDFIHTENIPQFLLLDELALAFIAFAAGAELERRVIQGYFRSIIALISGLVVTVLIIGVTAFFLIKDMVPFMAGLPGREILAIALLGGTVMIARSPSSALAIIKELRARGPFTHKVLGATVMMDAVVIVIFAATVSVAAVLVEGATFNVGLLIFVIFEILLDILLGILVGLTLHGIMHLPFKLLRSGLILLLGLSVFLLSSELHNFHFASLPVGLFSEPLLICMVAGFYMTNYSRFAIDFQRAMGQMSPGMFLLFFTLVGIELQLDVLRQAWGIVLILFVVRLIAIFIGSFAGTTAVKDRSAGKTMLGFAFITQAGVSVGLAKEIAVEFGAWGAELATLSIGVIVLNQIVGPPFLKLAIRRAGEAHTRADGAEFDGIRDVVIFGLTRQSVQLAHQLQAHDWQVKLAADLSQSPQDIDITEIDVHTMPQISTTAMASLDMDRIDAIITFLPDEESYRLCEMVYEHYGINTMVALLNDRAHFERFHELGVRVVEAKTAVVSLLEHFVRSPVGASFLLGMNERQDVIDVEVRNPEFHGLRLRDIRLPLEVLVLSVSRNGYTDVSHGYTKVHLGDKVTVVGSEEKLAEVMLRFEA